MTLDRPLPETDGLAGHYWESAAKGILKIQYCSACCKHQHYARPICTHCGSTELEWVQSAGKGMVLSCTTVHRGPYTDIESPYIVALIRLDEGVTLLSHLIGAEPDRDHCEKPVELSFAPLRDGVQLPVFSLVNEGES